jgi:hypothetical protein
MEKELIVPLATKTVILRWQEDLEIDSEAILSIDYSNIVGELLTFPVMFNRVGILKAEIEHAFSVKKMETDISISHITQNMRNQLTAAATGRVTDKQVEGATETSLEYREAKMALFEVKKQADIIDSLYWSAKSKDKKLEVMSAKIKPDDYEKEIMEGSVNGIMIKYNKSLIG